MIQKLDFAEPFFRVDYVEHEAALRLTLSEFVRYR